MFFESARLPNSPIVGFNAPDITAAMLDDKNKSISLLRKVNSSFIFMYCIVFKPGRLVTWLQSKNIKNLIYDYTYMFHDVLTIHAITS